MLPAFDIYGNLPPGIHICSIDELASRFGQGSVARVEMMEELLDFIETAKAAGVRRLLVNGSFVTSKESPNDVDVVYLPGDDYPRGGVPLDDEEFVWPFLQLIEALDDADFETWGVETFGKDNRSRIKGVVEVSL